MTTSRPGRPGGRDRPRAEDGSFFAGVYEVVRAIPEGRVTTYGAVSRVLVGRTTGARTVGWALHGLPPELVDEVPWWRVVNAQGRISTSCQEHSAAEQRARLEHEGVCFDFDGRIDLERFGWEDGDQPSPSIAVRPHTPRSRR